MATGGYLRLELFGQEIRCSNRDQPLCTTYEADEGGILPSPSV